MKLKTALAANAVISQLIAADKANKFVFASAVRIKLAGNLRKVKPLVESYGEEMNRLVKELKTAHEVGGQLQIPNRIKTADGEKPNPELADFIATQKAIDESEQDIVFSPIKEADLGENQIPIDLLADLYEAGLLISAPTGAKP